MVLILLMFNAVLPNALRLFSQTLHITNDFSHCLCDESADRDVFERLKNVAREFERLDAAQKLLAADGLAGEVDGITRTSGPCVVIAIADSLLKSQEAIARTDMVSVRRYFEMIRMHILLSEDCSPLALHHHLRFVGQLVEYMQRVLDNSAVENPADMLWEPEGEAASRGERPQAERSC